MQATPIVLVNNVTTIKNFQVIVVAPATKQSKSSGKHGSKKKTGNKTLPFLSNNFLYLSTVSLSATLYATCTPSHFPMPKQINEPTIIAVALITKHCNAPNIKTPAIVVTCAGIGKIITCNN